MVAVRNTNNDMRPTFRLSMAGRQLSSPGWFMLGVVGGIHDHQRSWVTLTQAAGIIGTETNNSLEFLPPAKPCTFRSSSCSSGDAIITRQSRCSQEGGSIAATNPGAFGPFNDASPQSCSDLSIGSLSTQSEMRLLCSNNARAIRMTLATEKIRRIQATVLFQCIFRGFGSVN